MPSRWATVAKLAVVILVITAFIVAVAGRHPPVRDTAAAVPSPAISTPATTGVVTTTDSAQLRQTVLAYLAVHYGPTLVDGYTQTGQPDASGIRMQATTGPDDEQYVIVPVTLRITDATGKIVQQTVITTGSVWHRQDATWVMTHFAEGGLDE